MKQEIMDCFTNPVKCKIFLEIGTVGQMTAKQIAEKYEDIPPATLYRYLKRMTKDGILKVVEETQIRGTVEKTYALAIDFNESASEIAESNSGEAYLQLFMQYVSGFIKKFQDYSVRPDIDIAHDLSGFTLAPIYATDEELESAMMQYVEIFAPLRTNTPAPEKKLRTIGLIISPPEEHK